MRQPNNKKGPEGMAKVNKDVVKRLMSYIGHYKLRFAAVNQRECATALDLERVVGANEGGCILIETNTGRMRVESQGRYQAS